MIGLDGPIRVLGEAGVEAVHDAAMRILAEIGCEVHDDTGIALMRAAGQRVDGTRVRVDPDWLLETAALAPPEFTLHGRAPGREVVIGGANPPVLLPSGGSPFCSDGERGRREGTLADHDDLVRLVHASGVLRMNQAGVVETADLPPSSRHLRIEHSCIRWSDLPFAAYGGTGSRVQDGLDLVAIVHGGRERLAERPAVIGIVNPNSPLVWDGAMVGSLVQWAEAGQPVAITPFLLGGASSPVSLAGALAQQTAEALFGIALAQLVRPGVPCTFGSFTTPVDMRSGGPAFGTPEAVLATLAGGELARRYRLPYRGGGGLCSANAFDSQAASESLMSLWATFLSGSHLVLHAAGWLEGGLTTSFEKLAVDVTLLRSFARIAQEIDVSEAELALEAIAEEGPGGMFLAADHTLERFRSLWMSPLFRSQAYPTWQKQGARRQDELATAEWKGMLEGYEDPGIDPDLETELQAFIAQRERELDG